jgi:hypothetical protein
MHQLIISPQKTQDALLLLLVDNYFLPNSSAHSSVEDAYHIIALEYISYSQMEIYSYFLYCILASCYISFTLNICSFVHQCNINLLLFIICRHVSASHGHLQVFEYTLQKLVLCYANFLPMSELNKQHGGHKDNTNILTHGH